MKNVIVLGLFLMSCALLSATPPVPVVQVTPTMRACPTYYCDPYGTTYFVFARESTGATVVLDALASFDADNDGLTFMWAKLDDGERFFDTAPRTTNVLFESARFRLYVSDGTTSIAYTFDVELITPLNAVLNLIDAMDELETDEGVKFRGRSSLEGILTRAAEHVANGVTEGAVNELERFQKRIAAQSTLIGSVDAGNLIEIAQAIIETLKR
jgi:hypothetical protein